MSGGNGNGGWRKSSHSALYDNCIEVAVDGEGTVQVRDDERPDEVIRTTPESWQAFVEGVRTGEFSLP